MNTNARRHKTAGPHRRSGFSLVEMLVVLAVLALLIGMAFKGASSMTEAAKVRETEALFVSLRQAIDAYKLEVTQSRAGLVNISSIYNGAPPDDMNVFTASGANLGGDGDPANDVSLVRGDPIVPDLTDPRDPTTGALADPSLMNHGDVRAMVLAMRLRSPKASEILDTINSKYRVNFGNLVWDPDDGTDPIPLFHYVDGWGNPIEYFSVSTSVDPPAPPRERAAFAFVHNSNAEPLLVSYGPNGTDQLAPDVFADPSIGDTTLISDYHDKGFDRRINHELNQDNVYSSDTFIERMK